MYTVGNKTIAEPTYAIHRPYGSDMTARYLPLYTFLFRISQAAMLGALVAATAANADELTQAQQAVDRATHTDADQYTAELVKQARQRLQQAQQAATDRHLRKQVPLIAQWAAADADLATARSQQAVVLAQLTQAKKDITQLQREAAAAASANSLTPPSTTDLPTPSKVP